MVHEKPERPPISLIRRSIRPPAPGHAWAWIILAVSVVIMTSITLWVVVSGKTAVNGLADREVVHQVTAEWRVRWSQVPGPPALYIREAEDFVRNRQFSEAAQRMSMALSLDASQPDDWARMVCLSTIEPTLQFAMSVAQVQMIMSVLEGMKIDTEAMKVARSLEQSEVVGGASVDAIDRCFGLEHSRNPSETGSETLDTLPVPP